MAQSVLRGRAEGPGTQGLSRITPERALGVLAGSPLAPLILAILSGLLLTLGFPPYGMWPVAWVALVPLLTALRSVGWAGGGGLALASGLVFYYTHMAWFIEIQGMTLARHVLAGVVCAWVLIPFGMAASLLYHRLPRAAPVAVPLAWVLAEYLHTHSGFLSLAWGVLAYSQYRVPFISGLSSFYGVFGVSAVLALTSSAVAETVSFAKERPARPDGHRGERASPALPRVLIPAAVTGLLLVPGFFPGPPGAGESSRARITVAAVQGKGEDRERGGDRLLRAFRTYRDLSLEASREDPDLIVWPETAVPGRIPYDGGLVTLLGGMARDARAHLVVGSAGYDKFDRSGQKHGRFANSAFLFRPDGKITGRYDKRKLVPFNEYLPLRGKFPWPEWIVDSNWEDSLIGEAVTLFSLEGIPFGVQICWENYFPEHFRKTVNAGARFVVSLNNESFVSAPAAHRQMLAINIYRAAENGVPVIRATPTGITAIIDARGRVIDTVQDARGQELDVTGTVTGVLEVGKGGSFYTRHGDWIVVLIALGCLPPIVAALFRGPGAPPVPPNRIMAPSTDDVLGKKSSKWSNMDLTSHDQGEGSHDTE